MSGNIRVLPLLAVVVAVVAGCSEGITTPSRSPLSGGFTAAPCPVAFFPYDDYSLAWPTRSERPFAPALSIVPVATAPADVQLLAQGGGIAIQGGCALDVSPPSRVVERGDVIVTPGALAIDVQLPT